MADNFDKFYPDWVVGTLTLVSGSRNFTATNAQLSLAAIREGDTIITPGGLTLPIESINANGNGGVLAQNAPTAAAGTYSTRIRYQSDNSRFTGMLAALVARMAGGNLQSLAALDGSADLLPIFTAAGVMGTVSKNDLVAGSLPPRLSATPGNIGDANTNAETGFYISNNGSQNVPTSAAAVIYNHRYSATAGFQIWFAVSSNSWQWRRQAASTWIDWQPITAAALSLLGLSGAANQMPYYTGASAAALTPISAKGRAVVAAASNDAVLTEILAAPRPSTSGRGLYASFQTSPGAAAVLPSGGTYAYWLVAYDAATGTLRSPIVASIRAGGSTIGAATSGNIWSGVYWNLT